VNVTIQATETTPNEPTRIVQTTFSIPVVHKPINPAVTFSESSIPNDTIPNSFIGDFTVHNLNKPYRLELIDSFDNGLELDPNSNRLKLNRPLNTFPLTDNRTKLSIPVRLIDSNNQTVTTTIFPLTILYPAVVDPCANKDCGNGRCVPLASR
jgi:hypothetical protein